ncbi:MAG: spore coat protein CotJB [Oscillospiraceae bacterium]
MDTHREDREALELYRAYQELYNKGVEAYVKEYGPSITPAGQKATGTCGWTIPGPGIIRATRTEEVGTCFRIRKSCNTQ